MRKPSSKADASNDIDIISIGALYGGGRWEKKYWTSSRSRDRHPYPVGYHAARTYNGINSTMEIQQGNTGPLFVITSSDGHTTSGQTPDIAWKKFQRACSPIVKSVRGKRLSPNIDGAEFFGFKYDLVQQLLREMVVAAASQGTIVLNTQQNNQFQNQSMTSSLSNLPKVCMEDKGGEKRKMDRLELISDNKSKKLNRSSTAATEDFAEPRPIERQTADDEKFCASLTVDMLNDTTLDQPLTLPNENLSSSYESDDPLTAEGSPTKLSQDGEIWLSNPTINAQKSDCDSFGEEITMSMMKLLLPQAVPLLRKASRNKKTTTDADSVDGKRNYSIGQDPNETKQTLQSSNHIVPDSFDTKLDEHKDLEQLPDVPDSCDELDDNACAEIYNNAYVPDSCDELENNAYAPDSFNELDENAIPDNNAYVLDSCDELDDNVYAPDFCGKLDLNAYVSDSYDELDENAYVPDSCDELYAKEIIRDSPQFNENHYASDSSDTPDDNDFVPDSCDDESDETENVPNSTGQLTDADVKSETQDSNVQACEGKAATCTSDGGKSISAKSMDRNEAIKETLNLEIISKHSGCGTRFSEYEGNSKENLMHQGRFNVASQQQIQDTNRTSHTGIANVSSDHSYGGTCPVGCRSPPDKCAFQADLKGGSNKACVPNHNLHEEAVKRYDSGCSVNNDGHCREATVTSTDVPHSSNVLHNKTPTCAFNEHFLGTQKSPEMDMVNNGEFMLSDEDLISMSETLHMKQTAFGDDTNLSVGQITFDSHYSKLSITKEPEKKLSSSGKLIGLPSMDKELMMRGENVSSTPQALLHHKQSAYVDDRNTSAGLRTFDGQYSKLSMVPEHENKLSSFGKLVEFPDSDLITDEELLMIEKMASSKIEKLHHKQSTSVDDSNKSTWNKAFDGYKSTLITATAHENKLSGFGKLIGLYAHPKPVLSVLLRSKGSETYICTSCGTLQDNQRTLFMYNLKVEGTSAGRPYFVGHSRMLLPDAKCFFGRQIALDKSGMQFTPNDQNLVLLNGMQLPSCRNGLVQCQCLECKTHSFEENAVKIVQLRHGYVVVLTKLKTVHRVLCLLVCEPNYLVAVEANGAFRFWTMNSTWRYVTEEFILPPTDCISPCAIELKQIPNCPHLVVGHNCFGEFGLWDISRHTIVSRFSIPDVAVFRFIPLSLFRRNRKDNTFTSLNTNEQSNSLKNKATVWSSQRTTNTMLNLSDDEDVVIPILVAARPGIKSSYRPMPDGCWKIGLLMNNKVFLNHTLNARAVTVAASGDCGVFGTNQGYLHVWDLSTGMKLSASLCLKDGRAQCLYTDNTRSGLLAVADDEGKLLLYFGDR